MSSEVTRLIDDAPGNSGQDRVTDQDSKVDEVDAAEIKKDETKEYRLIDNKSEPRFKKDKWKPQDDDKWKPVIDDSEKDKILMPPPGGFSRLPAG